MYNYNRTITTAFIEVVKIDNKHDTQIEDPQDITSVLDCFHNILNVLSLTQFQYESGISSPSFGCHLIQCSLLFKDCWLTHCF